MIAHITGRAIIILFIFSPLVFFLLFQSSTVSYTLPALAQTSASILETPEDEQAEDVSIAYDYEDIPHVINGYHKPSKEIVDVIVHVSEKMNFDWKVTYSICILESGCGTKMEGDGGLSHGWYHIYRENVCEYNGNKHGCIDSKDRYDIHKATVWTVNRLQTFEDLGRYNMIRSHNGLYGDHRNAPYVSRIEDFVSLLP